MKDIKTYAPIWRRLGVEELRDDFRIEVERILRDDSIPTWYDD